MGLLLLVSFIWAFSYGLIGTKLAGLDSSAVAGLRLGLALLAFLPFFRPGKIGGALALRLAAIGAVQFGLMYLLYQRAYLYAPSYAVALFTLTTPLYVALVDAALEKRLLVRYILAATLAVVGAGVVVFKGSVEGNLLKGFLLMQVSNFCFAAGQIAWRRERVRIDRALTDASLFALPYAGALLVAGGWAAFTTNWSELHISSTQWAVLAYLGIISSGACFFWWNRGATQVNAGTLAVFNNAKMPLAVACSLLFFHEQADIPRLLISAAVMAAAAWLAQGRAGLRPASSNQK
jgi:drug/metabolite transporter (DMT)-like permease